jgi:chaperonin GroEL
VEEGIIPGGEVGLIRAIPALEKMKVDGDEQIGVDVLRRALEAPLRQLVTNAGMEGSVIVEQVKNSKDKNVGFDAEKLQLTDMFAAGIIDPTKVARYALQNSSSIAGLLLTTESVIVDKPEKDDKMAGMGGAGMGGGMGGGGMPGMY